MLLQLVSDKKKYLDIMDYLFQMLSLTVFLYGSHSLVIPTNSGPISGTQTTVNGTELFLFLGIPFAKPPVGDLRFKKPVPLAPWNDTLDATHFQGSCPQSIPYSKVYYDLLPNKTISEDCLFINVYVPDMLTPSSPKSVMIWIHGGGYTIGQGMLYDGSQMAVSGDVIVVTFNYRLGILGFMSTGDSASPGNFGLWDQQLAMKWVQNNIAAFGGNPYSVTIFGESSGGFSVGLQMLIPQNKGLFKRAIAESGSGTSFISLRSDPLKTAKAYAQFLNCSSDSLNSSYTIVECLSGKSADDLITAQTTYGVPHFDKVQFGGGPLGPVLDGDLIKTVPMAAVQDPTSDVYRFLRSIDIIVGNVNAEGSLILFGLFPLQNPFHFNISDGVPTSVLCDSFAPDLVYQYYNNSKSVTEAICKQYSSDNMSIQGQNIINMYGDCFFVVPTLRSLDAHSRDNVNTKAYQFLFAKTVPMIGLQVPPWFKGAPHESELFYLFRPGTLQSIYNVARNPSDVTLSETMLKYWSNFAKTG